jgi:hypothetical protein
MRLSEKELAICREGEVVSFIEQGQQAKVNGRECRWIGTPLHQGNNRHNLAKSHPVISSMPSEWLARSRNWHFSPCTRNEISSMNTVYKWLCLH